MESNLGMYDRLARSAAVTGILGGFALGWIKGRGAWLLVPAGMLLGSVLSGYCVLYDAFGLSTRPD